MAENALESVDKVLKLLMFFKEGHPIRVTDAGNRLGVARSTAHRLLSTLERRGFVIQDPTTRSYLVGDALVGFAAAGERDRALARAARPLLDELAARLRETIHVTTLDGMWVTFVACAESPEMLRTGNHLGSRFPAYSAAAGKALLAELPMTTLRKLYADHCWDDIATTTRTWNKLLTELEAVRRRGYATNFAETEPGLTGIASPIKDARECFGALLMTAPATRVRRRDAEAWGSQLIVAARRIAANMPDDTTQQGKA